MLTQKPLIFSDYENTTFMELITIGFKPDLENDYVFQHTYRSQSIQFFYMKDIFSGLVVCILSLLINYQFLEKFKGFRADNYG